MAYPNIPALQQPTTIFQQLSAAIPPPVTSIRSGHVREDLVELMMIQNAQMHQVIMNNMTMSALGSFGHAHHLPPPAPQCLQAAVAVAELEEEDEEPDVYHHHYEPAAFYPPPYPAWAPPPARPRPTLVYRGPGVDPLGPTGPAPPAPPSPPHRDRRPVPPPPPPSATGTVGADIPPATEYYDATERR